MNYFFILGRTPSLSLLEISTVLKREPSAKILKTGAEAVLISGPNDLRVDNLVHTLGGVIKGGVIVASIEKNFDAVAAIVARDLAARTERAIGRITFGLSSYNVSQKPLKGNVPALLWHMGIALKKELKEKNVSARFVALPRGERALSSVVVEKNHLTVQPHAEYALLVGDTFIEVGVTSAVQEFEKYSYRDYGRPYRDMKTGLLPPKLARAMVNIADMPRNVTVLDPFCGFGTILQEALLLGYTNVWGSDIEKKNVRATRENLEWALQEMWRGGTGAITNSRVCEIKSGANTKLNNTKIKLCDAKKLVSCFSKHSVDAIITEPTLGPALTKRMPAVSQKEIVLLCDLYIASFRAFHDVLKNNGCVVIVFPVWLHHNGNPVFIPCIDDITRIGFINNTIPSSLKNYFPNKTSRNSLLVARPDARVGRELFVFQKITR